MKRNNLGDSWTTYVEVDEVECHPVEVNYDASEAEPDVGYGGGLDIESIIYKGRDLLGLISKEELDSLIERTSEHINTYYGEDPRY